MSSKKSFSSETANRYALALYELAEDNSELSSVEKDVNEFIKLYNINTELENFIKNPTHSQSNQLVAINKISVEMKLSNIVRNFLSILITKRRIFFLNSIFKNFLLLASKKKGELKAQLISSKSLTSDELKNLNSEISKVLGNVVSFDYKVDESLVGGLKMQIGSLMVDTSLKNKLNKYKQIMLEV